MLSGVTARAQWWALSSIWWSCCVHIKVILLVIEKNGYKCTNFHCLPDSNADKMFTHYLAWFSPWFQSFLYGHLFSNLSLNLCIIYFIVIHMLDMSLVEKTITSNIIIKWSNRSSKKRMHTTTQNHQYLT